MIGTVRHEKPGSFFMPERVVRPIQIRWTHCTVCMDVSPCVFLSGTGIRQRAVFGAEANLCVSLHQILIFWLNVLFIIVVPSG